jgi:hypothetical protein
LGGGGKLLCVELSVVLVDLVPGLSVAGGEVVLSREARELEFDEALPVLRRLVVDVIVAVELDLAELPRGFDGLENGLGVVGRHVAQACDEMNVFESFSETDVNERRRSRERRGENWRIGRSHGGQREVLWYIALQISAWPRMLS